MAYEMKAEYEFPAVSAWHIVPAGESRSLCGAPLAPTAPTRPLAELKITNVACRPCEVLHFSLRARAPMRRAAVQEAADRG